MTGSMFRSILAALVLLPGLGAQAQGETLNTCADTLNAAIVAATEGCGDLGRNQACYGNVRVETSFREGVVAIFEQVGDRINVTDIETLYTAPFDAETGEWGIALMALQANLPDTLPGQNVTFVLFGDVEITNETSSPEAETETEYGAPMQVFTFRTGIGALEEIESCQVPPSAIMVQAPAGLTVNFQANGVDIVLGSTLVLQAAEDSPFLSLLLEGTAQITAQDKTTTLEEGMLGVVRLDEAAAPNSTPGKIPYNPEQYQALEQTRALHLLPDVVTLPDPATVANLINPGCDYLQMPTTLSADEPVIIGLIIDAGSVEYVETMLASTEFVATLDGVVLEDFRNFGFIGDGNLHRAAIEPGYEAFSTPELLAQFPAAWIVYYPAGFLEPGPHIVSFERRILTTFTQAIIDGEPLVREAGQILGGSCAFTITGGS